MSGTGQTPTPEEIAAYETARARVADDYRDFKAWYQLASPTNAQTVAAIKALGRLVRFLVGEVRDGL